MRRAVTIESTIAGAGYLDFQNTTAHDPIFEKARRLNALIPVAPGFIPTAIPFVIAGAAPDRARATDCLAAAVYYEAGNNERGQRAVAQVVLNRLRHPGFARTICEVVFQGSDRRTGCQFTFTCDGAMLRYRPTPQAWQLARQVATEALHGYSEPAVGYATHYHTDWVYPAWSSTLTKIAAVDTHLFFQTKHFSPRSFGAPYAGSEPRIAAMASLSPAHATEVQPPIEKPPEVGVQPPASFSARSAEFIGEATERLPDQAQQPGPDIFLVVLDAGGPENHFRQAQARCGGRPICKFIGWTKVTKRPARLPMPGSAVDAISFSFTRTGNGDAGTAKWNCQEFPQANRDLCLRRGS